MRGSTRAELLFHHVLSFLHRQGLLSGERSGVEPLRKALKSAVSLVRKEGAIFEASSLAITDGKAFLGAALDRPVYVRTVSGLESCLACGGDVDGQPLRHPYARAVLLLDTDRLPSDEWEAIGSGTLFHVGENLGLETYRL